MYGISNTIKNGFRYNIGIVLLGADVNQDLLVNALLYLDIFDNIEQYLNVPCNIIFLLRVS